MLGSVLMGWAFLALAAACVETAECDETVACPDGQACYELRCRDICYSDRDCPMNRCKPCEEELPGGVLSHCFGDKDRVCVGR